MGIEGFDEADVLEIDLSHRAVAVESAADNVMNTYAEICHMKDPIRGHAVEAFGETLMEMPPERVIEVLTVLCARLMAVTHDAETCEWCTNCKCGNHGDEKGETDGH